jgi:UDP-glucuronate 4-epimerase
MGKYIMATKFSRGNLMTVLVTGGAGFIGSHLVQRLIDETEHAVVILDNFNNYYDPRMKRANAALYENEPRVSLVEDDFRDPNFCEALFARCRFSHVIHLGAYPGVPYSLKEPQLYIDSNITGTAVLLDTARRHEVERFLFASSSTVYGRGAQSPFVEDAALGIPCSPYGATKRAAELLGFTWAQLYGLAFTSLRFFNVYGPRLRPELALAVFTRKILAGEPLPLYGDGSVLRDFTHVNDVCGGVVAALTASGIAGQSINLGHNEPVQMLRLIKLIEEAAGKKAQVEFQPPRAEDMPLTCADLTKARRLLGYEPRVPIEEGVREYVEWAQGERGASAP